MEIAAFAVAALALLFTVGSFWWLHARRGRLEVAQPHAYAFASKARLRLPLAVYNAGAQSLIVADMRVRIDDDPIRAELEWITTRMKLRPEADDGFAFATPFAVEGRRTREVIAEFGHDEGWSPEPESHRRPHLDAIVHPGSEWHELAVFDWWAPPPEAPVDRQYLTYRNAPPGSVVDLDQDGDGEDGGGAEPVESVQRRWRQSIRVSRLTPARDVSAADWIVEALQAFGESVLSLVPAGFPSYVRVFHPAWRLDERGGATIPVRWADVAVAHGTSTNPGMQFQAVIRAPTFDYNVDPQPGVFDAKPQEGSLPRDIVESLAAVLARHTATPERCWFAIWNGWGTMRPDIPSAPSFHLPARAYPPHGRPGGSSRGGRRRLPL